MVEVRERDERERERRERERERNERERTKELIFSFPKRFDCFYFVSFFLIRAIENESLVLEQPLWNSLGYGFKRKKRRGSLC